MTCGVGGGGISGLVESLMDVGLCVQLRFVLGTVGRKKYYAEIQTDTPRHHVGNNLSKLASYCLDKP